MDIASPARFHRNDREKLASKEARFISEFDYFQ
jgi:hypothetical protein